MRILDFLYLQKKIAEKSFNVITTLYNAMIISYYSLSYPFIGKKTAKEWIKLYLKIIKRN